MVGWWYQNFHYHIFRSFFSGNMTICFPTRFNGTLLRAMAKATNWLHHRNETQPLGVLCFFHSVLPKARQVSIKFKGVKENTCIRVESY